MGKPSLLSAKHFSDFVKNNDKKYSFAINEILKLFNELGKKYGDEPAQSLFIAATISSLLKSCNAKKSEIKPFLEEIIEKTLKN
jgi:hypothetical protein